MRRPKAAALIALSLATVGMTCWTIYERHSSDQELKVLRICADHERAVVFNDSLQPIQQQYPREFEHCEQIIKDHWLKLRREEQEREKADASMVDACWRAHHKEHSP